MHVIDRSSELIAVDIASPPDVQVPASAALAASHRASEETVVAPSVQIDVQRPSLGIIDSGHVIPRAGRKHRLTVARHEVAAGVRELEADCARPSIHRCV